MQKILIDTDVLLDFYFDRQPFSHEAAEILLNCEEKVIQGYVTPVIVSNLYYILRKTSSHEKVLMQLSSLLEILQISQIPKNVIFEAINSEFKDFEDALQNFSAENENIKILVTRNIKDYKKSRLTIATPKVYLKSLINITDF
jgi:predicted nucleic acid-binding protein